MVKGEDFVEDFESAVGGFVSFLERSSDEIDIIVEEYADSSARGRNGQWKSDVLNLSLGWSKARRKSCAAIWHAARLYSNLEDVTKLVQHDIGRKLQRSTSALGLEEKRATVASLVDVVSALQEVVVSCLHLFLPLLEALSAFFTQWATIMAARSGLAAPQFDIVERNTEYIVRIEAFSRILTSLGTTLSEQTMEFQAVSLLEDEIAFNRALRIAARNHGDLIQTVTRSREAILAWTSGPSPEEEESSDATPNIDMMGKDDSAAEI